MISGLAGDGIFFTGNVLAKVFKRNGLEVFTFRDFPSNIRGEPTAYTIRASGEEIFGPSQEVDILVAFDCDSIFRHIDKLNDGGFVICDSTELKEVNSALEKGKKFFNIPIKRLAKENFGSEIYKNVITIGILLHILNLELNLIEEILNETFLAKKGKEVVEKNFKAVSLGKEVAKNVIDSKSQIILPGKKDENRLFITGDEAIAIGALSAGCRFFAGYPICPASEIMEWLAKHLPDYNGVVVQTEDEISAIHMALGASYAGARAMTATSGPGFSLMSEGLSLAGMTEIPIVIVYVQRVGPSTGMPTKSEQADLLHSIFAGHGDFPKIVISPATIEDCFYLTIKAFNLADKFQCPVIILTEELYGQNYQTVKEFDFSKIEIDRGKFVISNESINKIPFLRYKFTKDGISPRVIPSVPRGIHMVEGNEHGETGYRDETPLIREKMVKKRMKKLESVLPYLPKPIFHGSENAEIGIVGFGSTFGIIQETRKALEEKGIPIQTMHIITLWPLQFQILKDFINSKKQIFVVENNASGQLYFLLRKFEKQGIRMKSIRKFNSQPFFKSELLNILEREIEQ